MSASARLVVQMTPSEKTKLDQRATRAGLTTSEFVRRRIGDDDFQENHEQIEALLTVLERSSPTILQRLDEAIADAAAMTAAMNALGKDPAA
jgi:uncharacterized protein (DUF1778 family)